MMKIKYKTFKSLVALLIVCVYTIEGSYAKVSAEIFSDYALVNESILNYGDFTFKIVDGNITEIFKDNTMVLSASYENGLRTLKHGRTVSTFEYINGKLFKEVRDGETIEYRYISDNKGNLIPEGFTLDNNQYYYIWDNDSRISGIANYEGIEIAKYVYSGIVITDILESVNGEWVSSSNPLFVGNYNKIRLYGSYFDDETGWSYYNGVYEDVTAGRIVGLLNNDDVLFSCPAIEQINNDNPVDPYGIYATQYELQAEEWKARLLNNSNYNSSKVKEFYKDSSCANVEIIARMIYGENSGNTTDQIAIARVVLNRYKAHSSEFGTTLRDICGNPDQFNGLINPQALGAKKSSDSVWANATFLACLLCITTDISDWDDLGLKPIGISTQKWFRSASVLDNLNQFKYENGQLYVKYSSYIPIREACIAGKGVYTTIADLKKACGGNLKLYNVFFDHN